MARTAKRYGVSFSLVLSSLLAVAPAAALLSLAVLEHWFLVLPLPSAAMWSWSLRSRAPPAGSAIQADPLDPLPAKTAL